MTQEEKAPSGRHLRIWIAVVAVLLLLAVAAAVAGYLYYTGRLWFNDPGLKEYPVRGIDVSEHQGEIDWERVRQAGYDFAFVKATEGINHVDSRFGANWERACANGLALGAYHFFSFNRPGLEQARNFIETVPVEEGSLPPAVDIEIGGNSVDVPDREAFRRELDDFLRELEAHYDSKPILYVNDESYERFIMGAYEDYPVWIADTFTGPGVSDGRPWLFWQYNPRGHVDGIGGYVDLNVFNGSEEKFARILK